MGDVLDISTPWTAYQDLWILFPNASPICSLLSISANIPVQVIPISHLMSINRFLTALSPYALLWTRVFQYNHVSLELLTAVGITSTIFTWTYKSCRISPQLTLWPYFYPTWLFISIILSHLFPDPSMFYSPSCLQACPSFSILFPKLWHTRLNNHLLTKVHFALHLGQVKHVYHHISVCCIMITILINCLSAYYPCLPCSTCPSLPKHSIYINFVRQGPWRSCSLVDLQL